MRPAETGFAAAARRLLRIQLPPAALLTAAAATVAIAVAAARWRGPTAPAPGAAQLDERQARVAPAARTPATPAPTDLPRA
ncbi:sel1 repeat family protein, partial [Burkholderia pseudomultivorans]|nr:sel1 repeat family protein [Burkholderia pseudomultivorans]